MTRYPPQGPPPEGYPPASEYGYQQSQYGSTPPPGAPYGYGYPQQNPSISPYNNDSSAQSHYGPSHQQYPQANPAYPPPEMQQPYRGYPPPAGPPPYPVEGHGAPFRSHLGQPGVPPAVPYQSRPPPNVDEGDRGIMGALAGGAAGAYGGHKMGHGFLGAVGGAFAGHKLEDAYKDHREEKKEKKEKKARSRRGSSCSSSSASSCDSEDDKNRRQGAPVMAGNFHASSRNVRLENDSILVAECADCYGNHHWTSIDLNDCLTNTFGRLEWARGGNFRPTARHIRLEDNGSTLEADLGDGNGAWTPNRIYLNERITNDNGRLMML